MQILHPSDVHIADIVTALRAGKTIVYPTETCYGLGCDAANADAVERVFAIKGREKNKAVLMLAASVEMVKAYAEWSPVADWIARTYWPGAVTMVLPVRPDALVSPGVVGEGATVAFRVGTHPFASQLVAALGAPLVSTSANLSGGPNMYASRAIIDLFASREVQPDMLIDAGALPVRPPSTIVRVVGNAWEVLRQGEVEIAVPSLE